MPLYCLRHVNQYVQERLQLNREGIDHIKKGQNKNYRTFIQSEGYLEKMWTFTYKNE